MWIPIQNSTEGSGRGGWKSLQISPIYVCLALVNFCVLETQVTENVLRTGTS